MKKIAIACALAICAFPFAKADEPAKAPAAAETQSGDEAAIKKTAKKFFTAIMCKGDIDTAKKYMSKETVMMLDGFEEMAKKQDEKKYKEEKEQQKKKAKEKAKGVKIEKKDVKVDGDKATVTFKLSKEGEKEAEEEKIDLVKEDGEWKVAVKK